MQAEILCLDTSGNPIPLDDGSGNVADTDSVHGFRDPYTVTPPTTLTGVANYEYAEPDLTNGRPLSGTLNPGQNVVILKYKRKTAGNITVNHYEVGGSTELYTPTGSTTPSAQTIPGAGKLGTTVNLTNKEADIANFEYVSTDVTGADSATTPTATGDTTLTHKATAQTVIYRYRRKNAGDVIVHHYEQGTNRPLVTDITLNGTNKLGLPYNTNNLSIPNYTLVAMPSNQNGIFAVGTQHVYYT